MNLTFEDLLKRTIDSNKYITIYRHYIHPENEQIDDITEFDDFDECINYHLGELKDYLSNWILSRLIVKKYSISMNNDGKIYHIFRVKNQSIEFDIDTNHEEVQALIFQSDEYAKKFFKELKNFVLENSKII